MITTFEPKKPVMVMVKMKRILFGLKERRGKKVENSMYKRFFPFPLI